LTALAAAGMESDQFHFAGFVDEKKFTGLSAINSTLIFFESPKRVVTTLENMEKYFPTRKACIARELTKIYEEFKSGSFAELAEYYSENVPRGEVVILLSPPAKKQIAPKDIEKELKQLLKQYKLKEASEILATKYGISKKAVYEHGIRIKNN
jgi:16S rRNA (cytidine1402-2'-O)-methyltransferase